MMLLTLCGPRNRQSLSARMLRMARPCVLVVLLLLSNQPQQRFIHLHSLHAHVGADGKQARGC